MTLARETINAIMTTVARTHDWGSRWAYDGKKSLYSIDPKLPFPEVGFVAEIEEEGRKSQFRVQVSCALSLPFLLNTKHRGSLALTGALGAGGQVSQVASAFEIDLGCLNNLSDRWHEAVMALDVVIRHTIGMTPGMITLEVRTPSPLTCITRVSSPAAASGSLENVHNSSLTDTPHSSKSHRPRSSRRSVAARRSAARRRRGAATTRACVPPRRD